MVKSDIEWQPTKYHAEQSNLARFLDQYDYEYDDLRPETESELAELWGRMVEESGVVWRDRYDAVVDTSDGVEFANWFVGGRLNAVETILDQWVDRSPDRSMYVWEDEQGNTEQVSYAEMARRTNRLANALRDYGIGRGDVVGLTFPLHPNGFAASLACLRVGAAFTQIFPGYGAEAMGHRLDDAEAAMVIAADGYYRGGSLNDLLAKVDAAVQSAPTVDDVVVYEHLGVDGGVSSATRHSWASFVDGYSTEAESEVMDADDTAFIAYSSGTTGAPKGTIHTHTSLVAMGNKEGLFHFDLSEGDTLMWITDFGWIIVPIWLLAGAPALGATTVLLEGGPTTPTEDRVWQAIEDYDVTTFGISPTGARSLRDINDAPREDHDLTSLRVLGSTGEPWDDAGWRWFLDAVGDGDAPIINASGGTELAGAILSPTPVSPLKPSTLYAPAPGVAADIYDSNGNSDDEGYLVVELPIPGMTHSLTGGDERYLEKYWRDFEGVWNQSDWAKRDEDGFWFITGRTDDTMNIAGRRVTAPEIEEAIAGHTAVSEAAVVAISDETKGQVPIAFVTLHENVRLPDDLESQVQDVVAADLGAPFRPARVHVVPALPKTQTGKIPRGVLESVYQSKPAGNVSKLEHAEAFDEFPRHKDF